MGKSVCEKEILFEVAWLRDTAVRGERRIYGWMEILIVFAFAVS